MIYSTKQSNFKYGGKFLVNQIRVLLNHLMSAKEIRDNHASLSAKSGWVQATGLDGIELHQRINELVSITINLHSHLKLENEIDDGISDSDKDWILEVLKGLSLEGNFSNNIDGIHKYTLKIIQSNIKNWNHGYTIQSSLDHEKIFELISKLQSEKDDILQNKNISRDLKRVLISEIDRLMYCLKNFEILGNEFAKEAITTFYSHAFFNKDIENYYQSSPSFKDVIDQLSAAITIGTFTTPAIGTVLDLAQKALSHVS